MTCFDRNLPILRRAAGFTQESLAEALGVSRQAVSKWESGQTLPEASTLLALADLLQCTLDQLMREKLEEDGPGPGLEQAMEEEARFALFVAYDSHMNRYAAMMAGGVFLVLFGVGMLLCLFGAGINSGAGAAVLLLCVAAAVFLFVFGGTAHADFQKAHPVLPEFYTAEASADFRRRYRAGIAAAVAGILAALALMVLLLGIFQYDETMQLLSVALGLILLGAAVGAVVLLALLRGKYDLRQYAENAAVVRKSAGLDPAEESEPK